jgi:hypothetical protein
MNRFQIWSFFLILIFLFLQPSLNAQESSFNGYLTDENRIPLPFAAIRSVKTNKGFITSSEGFYSIRTLADDTLCFQLLGFQRKCLPVNELNDSIVLVEENTLLMEVPILANDEWLYKLLAKCAKGMKSDFDTSRCYFQLTSNRSGVTVERFEAYYNGITKDGDLKDLFWKHGRYALKPQKGFPPFISMESSRAMLNSSLRSNTSFFPIHPLALSKKKMEKTYDLQFIRQFRDELGQLKMEIEFIPSIDEKKAFSGSVIVDPEREVVDELVINIQNTEVHPFVPLWPDDELRNTSISIRKRYSTVKSSTRLQSIDFKYSFDYHMEEGLIYTIESTALLYAFDYNELFTRPHFVFVEMPKKDFRTAIALPYHKEFWKQVDDFRLRDPEGKSEAFFFDPMNMNSIKFHLADTLTEENSNIEKPKRFIIERPFRSWSKARVGLRSYEPPKNQTVSRLPSEQYKFVIQLYADFNMWNDSLNYITSAIFDPIQSYYYLQDSPLGNAFFNIYFDLVEIQRRKLDVELKKCSTLQEAKKVYHQIQTETDDLCRSYLKEARRGENWDAFKEWNQLIVDQLKIDNIELFSLSEAVED